MATLIVGAGGIGSWFADHMHHALLSELLEPEVVLITDHDNVSAKNLGYSNFDMRQVGRNKANCISEKYNTLIPSQDYISDDNLLKKFNTIILCVDNHEVREIVYNHCLKTGKYFIDCRADGKLVSVFDSDTPKYLNTLDLNDTEHGSCQLQADIMNNNFQFGNRISAAIGMQFLINNRNGIKNNKFIRVF